MDKDTLTDDAESRALWLLAFSVEYAGAISAGGYDDEDAEHFREHLCNLTQMSKCSTLSLAMRQSLRYHAHVLRQMLPHKTEV